MARRRARMTSSEFENPPEGDLPPGAITVYPPPRRQKKSFWSRLGFAGWSVFLLVPLLVVLSVFLVLLFVGRPYVVHGSSMLPTLEDGDRVFVVSYRGNTTPDRGDVVVLKNIDGSEDMLIKRVVALPGDRITVKKTEIVVNDREVYPSSNHFYEENYTRLVPDGNVFVMGDNEKYSFDSRSFGPVEESSIVGKAVFIFWPPGHLKTL